MPFELDNDFIDKYVSRDVDWGPVGYVTYKRTYARSLDSIKEHHRLLADSNGVRGTEEWWLTVTRVVEGTYEIQRHHCEVNRLPWNDRKAQESAQVMYDLMFNFKFTPPGRGLWMMGTPVIDKVGGAALNNCAFVSTKAGKKRYSDSHHDSVLTQPFTFLMDMSMLGVGVGFDTLGAGNYYINETFVSENWAHKVVDSREGWVEVLQIVLEAYFYDDMIPIFDYSDVRPYGSPIMGFGGTASGPEPLKEMIASLRTLLDRRVGSCLTSSDIVDIMNLIGRCVVAGNVRRSAELAIGSPDDEEFLNLKNYELYPEECANWRWASNNSVSCKVGMDYTVVSKSTANNGEPGYIWMDNARQFSRMGREADNKDKLACGVNPCSEQTLEDKELCCLCEVYPARHDSYEDFERTLKYAYLYTKSVTLVPTHNYETNRVITRNRRIGVSLSGLVQAMNRHGRRSMIGWMDSGYDALTARDKQYSRWLGIPESIKRTSMKPGGSVPLLMGATPGLHHPESEYYYRVIRFDSSSPLVKAHEAAGYMCVNLEPGEPNTTAIYFPVHEKYYKRGKRDISMWEQLELAAVVQEYWADNQVSITVTFTPDEAKDIKYALELYESRLKSVSFLPLSDHGYKHAPYQPISKLYYEEYKRRLLPVNYVGSKNEVVEKFCDGDKCTI